MGRKVVWSDNLRPNPSVLISFGDRLLDLAVLVTSLPSNKGYPGPLICIFEVDTFFFLSDYV